MKNSEHDAAGADQEKVIRELQSLKELLNFTPFGLFLVDLFGIIVTVNKRGTESLGKPIEALKGTHLGEHFPPDVSASRREKGLEVLASLEPVIFEDQVEERWYENRIYPIFDDKGAISHLAVYGIDITEQKNALEALRKSEERYKDLADSLPQTVFETDEGGNLIFVNRTAFRRFGYTQKDFDAGLNALEMVAPEDRDRAAGNMMRIMNGETTSGFEYLAQKKDGSTFPIVIHSNLIERENKSGGLRGIIIDISDRKRMEEEKTKLESQLQQAQKMEAIGTLAGGIAHDFNNILFPMIGFLEMMIEDVPKSSSLQTGLKEVMTGAKRAAELVKQILAFSRQTEQERKPVKIQIILEEILNLIRASIPTTIEIRHDINEGCGFVMADSIQIHQVVMNLITNAYHAMQDTGGRLEIFLKEVSLGPSELKNSTLNPEKFVCFGVADTGTGMNKSLVKRIFDPYFTTKETGKGTGLGLSVAHGIIKSHGGNLTVKSEPGKGTRFQIFLPVLDTRPEAGETEKQEPVQKGTGSILLIDDDEMVVKMEHQMLEGLGYQVTSRTSSLDALDAFQTNPEKFDLVITDMTMPGLTGVELSHKLLEIKSGMPIIICTGFSEQIDEAKAENLGISGYVNKPVVRSVLARTIRRVLEND